MTLALRVLICSARMASELRSRTLRAAASIVGGPRRLAQVLGARPSEVLAWLSGTSEPPQAAFLKALEVILSDLDARER
jgi:hypothetical protein